MKIVKRTKKIFFNLTVKSPVTVLVIIVLVVSSLLYISFTSYSSIYVKAEGTLQRNNNSKDNPYVKIKLNKKYKSNINKNTPVIWYCNNGRRYNGSINEIDSDIDKNSGKDDLSIDIALAQDDVKVENPKEVTVEVLVKQVRIIEKLTMKEDD
jgi:Tfp pilus assembly major pilin PilA